MTFVAGRRKSFGRKKGSRVAMMQPGEFLGLFENDETRCYEADGGRASHK